MLLQVGPAFIEGHELPIGTALLKTALIQDIVIDHFHNLVDVQIGSLLESRLVQRLSFATSVDLTDDLVLLGQFLATGIEALFEVVGNQIENLGHLFLLRSH